MFCCTDGPGWTDQKMAQPPLVGEKIEINDISQMWVLSKGSDIQQTFNYTHTH